MLRRSLETANEFEKRTPIKVLVVEDQYYQQYNLIASLFKYYNDVIPSFKDGEDIKLVRSYKEVRDLIDSDKKINYDVVFLDNMLLTEPGYNPNGPIIMDERFNFDEDDVILKGFKFYKEDGYNRSGNQQVTDGYKLINEFKNKGVVVVGTSTANSPELLNKYGQPDFVINKMKADPCLSDEENSLNAIKENILETIQKKREQ